MKKIFDKGIIFHVAGTLILAAMLLIISGLLDRLNILTYLLVIGIIPAVILFICSLLHSSTTRASGLSTYVTALVVALLFAGIMLAYCGTMFSSELVDSILANSVTSDTTQVSMSTASAGDNIQSILLFVAFSAAGAFIGNRIRRKKTAKTSAVTGKTESEYDD